jgi:hypothetical protein
MLFLEFVALWKAYPDLPFPYFEEVLHRRDDLDKAVFKEVVENCRNKTREGTVADTGTKSIFSKLTEAIKK